jgi:hypothetical protein
MRGPGFKSHSARSAVTVEASGLAVQGALPSDL